MSDNAEYRKQLSYFKSLDLSRIDVPFLNMSSFNGNINSNVGRGYLYKSIEFFFV